MKRIILALLLLCSSLAYATEFNFAAYHDNKTNETCHTPIKVVLDLENALVQVNLLQIPQYVYHRIYDVEEKNGDLFLYCKEMNSGEAVLIVLHRTYNDLQVWYFSDLCNRILYENQN